VNILKNPKIVPKRDGSCPTIARVKMLARNIKMNPKILFDVIIGSFLGCHQSSGISTELIFRDSFRI